MSVLEQEIQNKIDQIVDEAYEQFELKNINDSFSLMYKAWDLFPEPKKKLE